MSEGYRIIVESMNGEQIASVCVTDIAAALASSPHPVSGKVMELLRKQIRQHAQSDKPQSS